MRSTNRKSLSFVAGLLKVKGRGESLVGHWVYRAAFTDEAESERLQLLRQRQPSIERTGLRPAAHVKRLGVGEHILPPVY